MTTFSRENAFFGQHNFKKRSIFIVPPCTNKTITLNLSLQKLALGRGLGFSVKN